MALPILRLKETAIRDEVRAGALAEADYIRGLQVPPGRATRQVPELRLVPPRKRALRVGTVILATLFLTLMCITVFQTQLAQRQIGVERINREIALAREKFDRLRKENAMLSSPDVIAAQAKQLGMSPGSPQKAIAIDADSLAEAAEAVGAAPAVDHVAFVPVDPLAEHKRLKQVTNAGQG
jgi:cell division protein FtsL